MIYAAKSIAGIKADNEDMVYIPKGGEISLAIVADGMGGHVAGNVASKLAVETIVAELKRGGPGGPVALITNAVNKANTAVFELSQSKQALEGMGTTVVAALLFSCRFIAANVGDSRLYHFDGTSLTQVTIDHSYVTELVNSGYITREEAARHPRRNLITRALGTRQVERVDVFERAWREGDLLLLCSDGLYSEVSEKAIIATLNKEADLQLACEMLVNMALKAGSTDNISAVIVYNGEVRP